MDPVLLKTFVTVTECGSFSSAGEALNSVQSNITARIRKLEEQIGGPLFERGRSGATLTPLGERLLSHATDILTRIRTAEADLRDATGRAAPLRLGSMETTAGGRLPAVLRGLSLQAPDAEITLTTGSTGALTGLVWERRLDAAFVAGPVDADRFRSTKAFEEKLAIVRPSDLPHDGALLAFRQGCSYRATALEWLRSTGKGDTPVRDFGSLDAILGCVAAGMGFTVFPEHSIAGHRLADTLETSPLDGPYGVSDTFLIWRHDLHVTHTFTILLEQFAR